MWESLLTQNWENFMHVNCLGSKIAEISWCEKFTVSTVHFIKVRWRSDIFIVLMYSLIVECQKFEDRSSSQIEYARNYRVVIPRGVVREILPFSKSGTDRHQSIMIMEDFTDFLSCSWPLYCRGPALCWQKKLVAVSHSQSHRNHVGGKMKLNMTGPFGPIWMVRGKGFLAVLPSSENALILLPFYILLIME